MHDNDPRTWVACRDCKGTTWVLYRCERGEHLSSRDATLPRRVCDRTRGHAPHTYADRCLCATKRPMEVAG